MTHARLPEVPLRNSASRGKRDQFIEEHVLGQVGGRGQGRRCHAAPTIPACGCAVPWNAAGSYRGFPAYGTPVDLNRLPCVRALIIPSSPVNCFSARRNDLIGCFPGTLEEQEGSSQGAIGHSFGSSRNAIIGPADQSRLRTVVAGRHWAAVRELPKTQARSGIELSF